MIIDDSTMASSTPCPASAKPILLDYDADFVSLEPDTRRQPWDTNEETKTSLAELFTEADERIGVERLAAM